MYGNVSSVFILCNHLSIVVTSFFAVLVESFTETIQTLAFFRWREALMSASIYLKVIGVLELFTRSWFNFGMWYLFRKLSIYLTFFKNRTHKANIQPTFGLRPIILFKIWFLLFYFLLCEIPVKTMLKVTSLHVTSAWSHRIINFSDLKVFFSC